MAFKIIHSGCLLRIGTGFFFTPMFRKISSVNKGTAGFRRLGGSFLFCNKKYNQK
jgi:hypothetical protein